MTATRSPVRDPELRHLECETIDAWLEYLNTTRLAAPDGYDDVEPWAWARLQRRLVRIGGRRHRLLQRKAAA